VVKDTNTFIGDGVGGPGGSGGASLGGSGAPGQSGGAVEANF